ncbi:MAG: CocE/NonD family hydrolase [Euryarchaeota archaeon]|nr:CocE/NonD family hydrolase [Euryarchaeota archaeon]
MVRVPALSVLVALVFLSGCLQATDPLDLGADSGLLGNLGGAPGETVTSVFPGEYDFEGRYSRVLEAGTLDILPGERIVVPSALDGADILMGVHRPKTDEPVPVLLFASPYFGFIGGTNDVTHRLGAFGNLVENFVPHGYAVVGLAIRGTGGAGGCNDLMGPEETADLDQAVTWLGTQDWSNGNIAMTGVSYDGSTPWAVASTGNPHLKTIIPISGVPDMYGLMYRNGTSESRGPVVLNALYYGGNIVAGTATPTQMAERVVCPEAMKGIGWSVYTGLTGAHDPEGFWKERDRKPDVMANYKGSVFSVQGLQDWNVDPSQVVPWVDELERSGIRTKQLLGQWAHAWPDSIGEKGERAEDFRADHNEILLRWLDQELKGKVVDTGAPVQVRDNLGRWRNEAHYPPHDTAWTTLHLTPDGLEETASGEKSVLLRPAVQEGWFPYPPEETGEWIDLSYGPVADDLLVVGLPKVHVAVTPLGPGSSMAAYLYERDADGQLTRLGWTSMNLAFADGGTERKEVVAGETIVAKMEVQPMDGVVRAGNELVLRVWVYADADRLPSLPPSPVLLELGHDLGSVLKLPSVERGAEVYFEVPVPEE